MSDEWWHSPAGVQSALREEIKMRNARIEELEAKLAKAVDALQNIADGNPTIDCPEADAANSAALARAALAEINGGDDD